MGYSPWGCKESDMTEHTHTHTHNLFFMSVVNDSLRLSQIFRVKKMGVGRACVLKSLETDSE